MRSLLAVLAVTCSLGVEFVGADDGGRPAATNRRSLRVSPDPLGSFRAGLEKRVKLDFADAPLEDVIAHLAEQAGVAVRLDEDGIESEGIPLDERVTLRSRGVSVKTALARVLEPLNLGWVIENEELVVTSTVFAEERLVIGVYDVRRLLEHPPRQERLQRLLDGSREYPIGAFPGLDGFGMQGVGGAFFQIGPGLGGGWGGHPPGFPPVLQHWRPRDPYGDEWLISLIERTVGWPEHWVDQGGPAAVWDNDGRYHVRHLVWAHDDLDALLTAVDGLTAGMTKSVVRPFETEGERRIRLALDRRISVGVEKLPIDEFARLLGDQLEIDVELEEIAFEEEGLELDEPVTLVAKDTSVRVILARVLDPLNCRWIVDEERLLITSSIVAEELGNLEIALVDARDVVRSFGGTEPLIEAIVFQSGPPESWADEGGSGDVSPIMDGVLVVRQTADVLDEIEGVVATLRKTVDDREPKPMPKLDDVRTLDYTLRQHDLDEVRSLVEVAVDGDWDGRDWLRAVGSQLFVKTTLANHLEIDRLLRKLKMVKTEVRGGPGSEKGDRGR